MRKFILMILILLAVLPANANEVLVISSQNNEIINFQNKENDDTTKALKMLRSLQTAHIALIATGTALFYGADGVGISMLVQSMRNNRQSYYSALQYIHIGFSAAGIAAFASGVALGFARFGIKKKQGFDINRVHFAMACTNLGLYVLEVTTIILSAVFFSRDLPGKEWVGLAHGISCGLLTVGIAVSLGTAFIRK